MIVYKWVIEQKGKYWSLINFGIDSGKRKKMKFSYEIGKIYKTKCRLKFPNIQLCNKLNALTYWEGFHFWKEQSNPCLKSWNQFLINHRKQPKINACLICEVNSIFVENDYQLVAGEFKPIGVIKL